MCTVIQERVRKDSKNEEAVEKDLQPAQHPTFLHHDYRLKNPQDKNLSGKKASKEKRSGHARVGQGRSPCGSGTFRCGKLRVSNCYPSMPHLNDAISTFVTNW